MRADHNYYENLVKNEEGFMSGFKRALAGQYSIEVTQPFYSSMSTGQSARSKEMSSQEVIDGIKSGKIEISAMEGNRKKIDLRRADIKITDEYNDPSIRMIRVDVRHGKECEKWLISNVDFSKEYQTYLAINEKDKAFYNKINNNHSEHRKAHCLLMDIMNRDFKTVDEITWKALEGLNIIPEYKNKEELNEIVLDIKDEMLSFCDAFGIEIDAMNTLPANVICDIRGSGRDVLREIGIDAVFNQKMDEISHGIDGHEYEEELTQSR